MRSIPSAYSTAGAVVNAASRASRYPRTGGVGVNDGYVYRVQVQRGGELLSFLTAEYPHSDAATWAARVAAGEVSVNGAPPSGALRPGDVVTWARPPWHEPPVPTDWSVVYDDGELLVVDKPAGLPTMPAGGFLDHTLLAMVRASRPDASPMHRLGRGTSGLVVFACTAAARARLQAAWRTGAVQKTYRAVVTGDPPAYVVIDAPIGPVAHPRLGTVYAATPDGRRSRSVLRRVAAPGAYAHVDVDIETGRPHQIRIHTAFLGHPLVGDPLYGPGGLPRTDALPGDTGYTLRAWRLGLPDGLGGVREVEVPPVRADDGASGAAEEPSEARSDGIIPSVADSDRWIGPRAGVSGKAGLPKPAGAGEAVPTQLDASGAAEEPSEARSDGISAVRR